MDNGQLREPGRRMYRVNLPAAAFFVAAAGLAAILWCYAQASTAAGIWPRLLWLLALQALLCLALERLLSSAHLRRERCYRGAFFGSLAVSLAFTFWRLATPPMTFDWLVLATAAPGAFLGGLLATGLAERLWEDNSPPSEGVTAEVLQRHRESLGSPQAEPFAKRAFDISLALAGLLLSAPVWLVSALLIWFEDPGPLLFVKNSVGKGGVNFRQLKLRTMVREAENQTGPVLSSGYEDERVLLVGRILRKTALDELPQLINILRGEMSFVGPRPQRTVLVHSYIQRMPEYAERHRVLPGLAGLAQVAGDYYLTPRQKLRLDRLYIQHRSLGFDLKLILMAFTIAFWFRWQKDWNGRLPRKWFR
jgi:lipopolysaccharide/colanic/teichoic acid biosynthesis glycosyltransferase